MKGARKRARRRDATAKYGSSLLATVLFPTNPDNLMTFVWVWLMLAATIVLKYFKHRFAWSWG